MTPSTGVINNFLNGNLKDAKGLANDLTLSDIICTLMHDYGYSYIKAVLTASYLKTGEGYQDAYDAK